MVAGAFAPALPSTVAGPLQAAALSYGAIIAAFMAGSHWGLALYAPADAAPGTRLLLAIAAALAAWILGFLPKAPAALALAALFAALFLMDAWMARRGLHALDYWRLRQILSAGAALSYFGIAVSP
ncbi:DUF3429 family protein [Algiphilus sp.]|uniref:DUF3429 family protein n=1 Tax=Algiphilus sp. TaxID=1872431 RepID=UPI001CA692D7|nr:DUF3429 family protein [Algiphilus sp.]MBY8965693.1 DUF3429 family protein [Algiphilus acroporae]MCI5064076.1 DUF3429 family protein [Algiphilus sp.]MCI5104125.1 DUF3429 family protein [Algiphilus sp.]MCR9091595.1 DUF3429 family protein [Pseudomonadota bacterium]